MKTNYKIQGKKNRESGQRFELKVRKDLEKKGWIVDRWSNNVELVKVEDDNFEYWGKLIPAKSRYGLRTTGFPDFIAFKCWNLGDEGYIITDSFNYKIVKEKFAYQVIGVECKSNGYLSKEEKEKCKWYLENNVFSKILIASKGKKRGQIEYVEFK